MGRIYASARHFRYLIVLHLLRLFILLSQFMVLFTKRVVQGLQLDSSDLEFNARCRLLFRSSPCTSPQTKYTERHLVLVAAAWLSLACLIGDYFSQPRLDKAILSAAAPFSAF